MRQTTLSLTAMAMMVTLVGCGGNSPESTVAAVIAAAPSNTGSVIPGAPIKPLDEHDLNNKCWVVKAVSNNQYVIGGNGVSPEASSATSQGVTGYYTKPTDLAKIMIYAADQSLLAATGNAIQGYSLGNESDDAISPASEWTVTHTSGSNDIQLFNTNASQYLSVDTNGALTLAGSTSAATDFAFELATGCTAFPELSHDTVGIPFSNPNNLDDPVIGMADVHNHISATTFLGGTHAGSPFHKFGVKSAMASCEVEHGPDGANDIVQQFFDQSSAGQGHDTNGYPTFVDWPARNALTHEGTYYKWVERSWRSGLRLLVNDLVENRTLCSLVNASNGGSPIDCNEMDSVREQAAFMYAMQDYIDAQEGGPGEGWFRIVTNPFDARREINRGKLAIVLGIEISHLFDCDLKYLPNGADAPNANCDALLDPHEIQREIVAAKNIGVAVVFPIHEFDNGLGGNGIFLDFLNLGNRYDTNQFWTTVACPGDEANGFPEYIYGSPGANLAGGAIPSSDPISTALNAAAQGNFVSYDQTRRHCNARNETQAGIYATEALMKHKIMVEIDHIAVFQKSQVLARAEAKSPPYPIISTHGGHGGISFDQARRIYETGGVIYPYKGNGQGYSGTIYGNLSHVYNTLVTPGPNVNPFAAGFGADTNGLGTQAGPRNNPVQPVTYPFTLFAGADWNFLSTISPNAVVTPVVVNQSVVPESGRAFDIDSEGAAHYGMLAGFVREVQLENAAALEPLFRSAEVYLQTWERTVCRDTTGSTYEPDLYITPVGTPSVDPTLSGTLPHPDC